MKKTFLFALPLLILYSCSGSSHQGTQDTAGSEAQTKQLFDKVIAVHDEVMTYERMIMENKTKLDSLAKTGLPAAAKDSAVLLSKTLTAAENAMSDWMHKFEPDYSGKSNEEAVKYLTNEETKIKQVDTLTKAAIKASWEFYSRYKK